MTLPGRTPTQLDALRPRPNHPDIACVHGYARCPRCDWVSPNMRRTTNRHPCPACATQTSERAECIDCQDKGCEAGQLF